MRKSAVVYLSRHKPAQNTNPVYSIVSPVFGCLADKSRLSAGTTTGSLTILDMNPVFPTERRATFALTPMMHG